MPCSRSAALGLACLVTACAGSAGQDGAEPAGSAFTRALAAAYGELADSPAAQAQPASGAPLQSYFQQRRQRAAGGETLAPQPLFDLELPANGVLDLSHARLELNGLLRQQDARQAAPELAARAQSRFDCWAMGLARRLPETPLAQCRKAFRGALAKLRAKLGGQAEAAS